MRILLASLFLAAWQLTSINPPTFSGPVDVPAIPTETVKVQNCNSFQYNSLVVCEEEGHFTCADKSRGLWHDESNPPKYWCRRVQP